MYLAQRTQLFFFGRLDAPQLASKRLRETDCDTSTYAMSWASLEVKLASIFTPKWHSLHSCWFYSSLKL